MNSNFTTKQLERRAIRIIRSARAGKISSRSDALTELAEIIDVLEDQPVKSVKPVIVARLTVTRASGRRTIVEIREGCKFSSFYRFYGQDGARRSTKKWIRNGSRAEAPTLAALLERMKSFAAESNPVIHSKLRIIKCRAYKKLISARPDELGLVRSAKAPLSVSHYLAAR